MRDQSFERNRTKHVGTSKLLKDDLAHELKFLERERNVCLTLPECRMGLSIAHLYTKARTREKYQEATSCLLNCFPKVPCLTETQTCLVPGTFPFNFQTDVYSTGNLIPAALNRTQQTGWELFS